MRLRFLQAVPSSVPGFPFQAGQIVHLPRLTPEFRQFLKDNVVQLLPDEQETAVLGAPETATAAPSKARGVRA